MWVKSVCNSKFFQIKIAFNVGVYALPATDAKFSLSRSVVMNFNPLIGSQGSPAVVVHGLGKQGLTSARVRASRRRNHHRRAADSHQPQVAFVHNKYWNVWDRSTQCLLWDVGPLAFRFPHFWRKESSCFTGLLQLWLFDLSLPTSLPVVTITLLNTAFQLKRKAEAWQLNLHTSSFGAIYLNSNLIIKLWA